jgi:uncharacterized protein (DUF433 family)
MITIDQIAESLTEKETIETIPELFNKISIDQIVQVIRGYFSEFPYEDREELVNKIIEE